MSDPINDIWINSTVQIENQWGQRGTGFIIKNNEQKILVTNKHVLYGNSQQRDSLDKIKLHMNEKKDDHISSVTKEYVLKENQIPVWIDHPNPQVDVIGIDITNLCNTEKNLTLNPIPSSLIITSSLSKQYGISSGRTVVVLGYPLAIQHSGNNYPMRIPGSITSQIGQNLKDRWKNPISGNSEDRTIPGFLIESNVTLGSSGSPVILNPVVNMFGGEQELIGKPYPPFLLGIVSEEKYTFISTPLGDQPSYSGLTIAFDANTVLDIVNLFD